MDKHPGSPWKSSENHPEAEQSRYLDLPAGSSYLPCRQKLISELSLKTSHSWGSSQLPGPCPAGAQGGCTAADQPGKCQSCQSQGRWLTARKERQPRNNTIIGLPQKPTSSLGPGDEIRQLCSVCDEIGELCSVQTAGFQLLQTLAFSRQGLNSKETKHVADCLLRQFGSPLGHTAVLAIEIFYLTFTWYCAIYLNLKLVSSAHN